LSAEADIGAIDRSCSALLASTTTTKQDRWAARYVHEAIADLERQRPTARTKADLTAWLALPPNVPSTGASPAG
jgi:hypothetical protein